MAVTETSKAGAIAAEECVLRPLPQVALKVMELLREPDSTTDQLAAVASVDQALATEVLRVAGSGLYGKPRQISSLDRAIEVMGGRDLRSTLASVVPKVLHQQTTADLKSVMLWTHSLATAIAARGIAAECKYPAEEAYLAGLLHDVGKAVMDLNDPQRYQEVLEEVYNENSTFLVAEKEIFGCDHTEVGALVVERWNLASPLNEAVRLYHQPAAAEIEPKLCAIVGLAYRIAVKLGAGPEHDPDVELELSDPAVVLDLTPDTLARIVATTEEQINRQKSALDVP